MIYELTSLSPKVQILMGKKKEKSVAVTIFSSDRKKILLIQRRDVPVWVLPGGGMEEKENSATAALREVQEETGFETKIVRLVGEYFPVNRLCRHTYLYECSIIGGQPYYGEETKNITFFPLTNLPPMPPPYTEWIADAYELSSLPLKKKLLSVNYITLLKTFLSHPLLVLRFVLSRFGIHLNS